MNQIYLDTARLMIQIAPLVGAIKLMALGAVLGTVRERLPSLPGMRGVL